MTDEQAAPATVLEQMQREQERHAEANAFAAIVMNTLRDFLPYRCQREAYDELRAAFLKSDSVLIHRAELRELRKFRDQTLMLSLNPLITTASSGDVLANKRKGD